MEYFSYSQKAFLYKYVVMLSDTDQFKHMSFANYLKLMFLATDALFVSCFDNDFLAKNRLRLVKSRMQFKRQTVCGDNILIKVNSSEFSGSQFSLLYTFAIENSGELVSLARQSYELLDTDHGQKKNLTDAITYVLAPILVDEKYLI